MGSTKFYTSWWLYAVVAPPLFLDVVTLDDNAWFHAQTSVQHRPRSRIAEWFRTVYLQVYNSFLPSAEQHFEDKVDLFSLESFRWSVILGTHPVALVKKKRCSMGCTVVPHVLMRSLNPLRSLHPNIVPPGASAEGPVEGPIFPSRCPAQPPYGLTSLGLVL